MRWKQSMVSVFLPIILCLAILLSHGAAQGIKKVYTLREAISEAFARNPTLRATEETINQSIEGKKQARTEFFPKLSTQYRYTRFKDEETAFTRGFTITRTLDDYEWRSELTQPVFKGFELISSLELSKLGIDQSETETELAKLELALSVKVAYFDILIADIAVDVAEKDVAARKSNADVARSFYKVGMIPINELLQAEVEWANAKQLLVQTQNGARLARSAFNKILSRPVNAPVEVKVPDPPWEPVRGELQEYIERALVNRPEMKLINIGLFQADQKIRVAKSDYYPDVSIVGSYIKQGDTPDVSGGPNQDPRDLRATAVLEWTFWEWGKTRSTVREEESLKRQLMEEKRAKEDEIRLEVREALLDLDTAEKNIPTTRKAVEQGEENLRVSEERYKAQVTTITEVLDAQTRLTRSRVNYFGALYDHHVAKARLLRAMGEY